MPTITWDEPFRSCAQTALAGLRPGDQALIVFDGGLPDPPDWLSGAGARLLSTGRRQGPAAARNLAAAHARTDLLLFVDADVQVHRDAIERLRHRFIAEPELVALFGSYDDQPAAPGLVSRFRNLLHHHTHTSHPGAAITFWAGLGAIRRDAFLAVGGFDAAAYVQPSIEDIELGLRLHGGGARLALDPTILGTHHKRWTLRSMLVTDIRQRAIPWSRLLLQRGPLPATLNLDRKARFSAAGSLVLLGALPAAAAFPGLATWLLLAFVGSLALILALNRPLHRLLRRQMGWLQGSLGVALHILYLAYSSLTFVLVAAADWLFRPLQPPPWLRDARGPRRAVPVIGLALLLLYAAAVVLSGVWIGWTRPSGGDLGERLDEWRLFQAGIYPSAGLATAAERAIPYFRTSVYLPWAMPLFGLLFTGGGLNQGRLLVQVLSLLALIPMVVIGWRSLRPWGGHAAWLGGLAPVAIAGNSACLGQSQVSMLCMGLVSLQWLLLRRRRPGAAGFAWGLAMIKPQITLVFGLPLLWRGHRRGLGVGLILLVLLSAGALIHTRTAPLDFLASWLQSLPDFISSGNQNVLALLFDLWRYASALIVALGFAILVLAFGKGLVLWRRRACGQRQAADVEPASSSERHHTAWRRSSPQWLLGVSERAWQLDPLTVAGLLGVAGQLAFYHRHYDNILLFPALLACWRLLLMQRLQIHALLTTLTSAILWTPVPLLSRLPGYSGIQILILVLVSGLLAWNLRSQCRSPSPLK